MKNNFPGGVWPVMLTPFTKEGKIDIKGLEALTEWYIRNGVDGLFAVCQSSEMFCLTLKERILISKTVVEAAKGRVPVIASGHVSEELEKQTEEIQKIAETGVDAVILISNRLAAREESDEVWRENCSRLLERIDDGIPLGFYECPYPYKRVLSVENIKWCAQTGRFFFLKDTCCDAGQIREKLKAIKGTPLKLYNANTTTLLESLRDGASGYSGVMANFHPKLYTWLCTHIQSPQAERVSELLTMFSLIERQCYPVNAKWGLKELEHLPVTTTARVKEDKELTETFQKEVRVMDRLAGECMKKLQIPD